MLGIVQHCPVHVQQLTCRLPHTAVLITFHSIWRYIILHYALHAIGWTYKLFPGCWISLHSSEDMISGSVNSSPQIVGPHSWDRQINAFTVTLSVSGSISLCLWQHSHNGLEYMHTTAMTTRCMDIFMHKLLVVQTVHSDLKCSTGEIIQLVLVLHCKAAVRLTSLIWVLISKYGISLSRMLANT